MKPPKLINEKNVKLEDFYIDGKFDVNKAIQVFPEPSTCEVKKDARKNI